MKQFSFRIERFLIVLLIMLFMQACGALAPSQTDTRVHSGTGSHTGEFYLYRVDDSWAPEGQERKRYYVGDSVNGNAVRQWVPLKERDDITGLDGPDRIVTRDDLVKISLRQVFIKYFKEIGKGEIALILSFASGDRFKEDLLIYATQGQTLGSSLAFDDITIIGPEKLAGESLKFRLVMLEVDQIENQTMKSFIEEAAGIASTIQPDKAIAVKIASDVAQFIISLNKDDRIFDRTFELSVTHKGASIEKTPLLYGQYVLLLQEDRFRSYDVRKRAELATRPPAFGNMRFNLHAGRLFRAYLYRPTKLYEDGLGFESPDFTIGDEKSETVFDLGSKRVDFNQFFPNLPYRSGYYFDIEKHTSILQEINSPEAAAFRHNVLAFPRQRCNGSDLGDMPCNKIGDLDIWGDLGGALARIYCESVRYSATEKKSCTEAVQGSGEKVYFHFPAYLYPKAYTVLAQYPSHTHIVFSVSRVLGVEEKPAEERLRTFSEWIEAGEKKVREASRFEEHFRVLREDIQSHTLTDLLLKKAAGEKDFAKGICIIANGITDDRIQIKNPLYNELFHMTGEIFQSEQEVKNYIQKKYSGCIIK